MSANDIQHGGSHYKTATGLQHWDVCEIYGVGYLESAASKYIYRFKSKNGLEDLQKAFHYIAKLRELLVSHNRRPRGIVPNSSAEEFLRGNNVPGIEAKGIYLLWRWEDDSDLANAQRQVLRLVQENYGEDASQALAA